MEEKFFLEYLEENAGKLNKISWEYTKKYINPQKFLTLIKKDKILFNKYFKYYIALVINPKKISNSIEPCPILNKEFKEINKRIIS